MSKPRAFLNTQVSTLTGRVVKEGPLFGLELELEGHNVALQDVAAAGWHRTHDGSLRGESIEYTTAGPKTFENLTKLVTNLFQKFEKHNTVLNQSLRTSTHVHLNFSDRPFKDALKFFSLFTVFEELLQCYSGEDRKGNLFCISSREGSGIFPVLFDAVNEGSLAGFKGDRFKYAACNLSTLYKFGTVEVRTMRGAQSADQVNKWLSIVNDLYLYALNTLKSPVDLCADFSLLGADGLLRKVFSEENVKELLSTFHAPLNLHQSLLEGVRLLQLFAFEFDDAFRADPAELKKAEKANPFLPPVKVDGTRWRIWKHGVRAWTCYSRDDMGWNHGDCLIDDENVVWSGKLQRFVEWIAPGSVWVCPWKEEDPDTGYVETMEEAGVDDVVFRRDEALLGRPLRPLRPEMRAMRALILEDLEPAEAVDEAADDDDDIGEEEIDI